MMSSAVPTKGPVTEGEARRRRWLAMLAVAVIAGVFAWYANGVLHRMGSLSESPDRRYRDFYEFFSGSLAMSEGTDIYKAGYLGYIYPPLLAWVLLPITALGLPAAAKVWLGLKLVLLALTLWLSTVEVVRRLDIPSDLLTLAACELLGLLLLVDKLRAEMNMQQSNLLMLLCWVLGLRWVDRHPWLAGAALGFGANIKYVTLLAVPYLLIRRRWQATVATVVATIGWAMLPALTLGWGRNLEYLHRALAGVLSMTDTGEPTIDAAKVMKIQEIGMSVPTAAAKWTSAGGGATLLTLVIVGGVAALFLAAIAGVYRATGVPMLLGRGGLPETTTPWRGVVLFEWLGLVVVTLAFGPQTNSPHLSQLLLATVCAACLVLVPRAGVSRWPLVIGCAVMVAGFSLPPGGDRFADSVRSWHRNAGPIWCLMGMSLVLLWTGLKSVRGTGEAEGGEPAPAEI